MTMDNLIIKFLINNKQIRLYILQGNQIRQQINHKIKSATQKKYLLDALNITALLTSLNSDQQRFSLRFMSKDLKKIISTEGFSNNTITGFLTAKGNDYSFADGNLQVIKSIDGKYGSSYTSFTPLITGDLYNDIGIYYKNSEQIPTFVVQVNSNKSDENITILIQELPFASEGVFDRSVKEILENENNLNLSTIKSSQESIQKLFTDSKFLEVTNVLYSCGCCKEMFIGIIFSLNKEDQEDILKQKSNLKANCSLCGEEYIFTPEEIEKYLKL